MQQIIPYTSTSKALASLDNGGRFYNLFTEAQDGYIEPEELAKVAGVYRDQQKMMLYLEMATHSMDQLSRNQTYSALTDELSEARRRYCPVLLTPAEAKSKGQVTCSAIITGIPKFIEAKSEFKGFIIVPVMAGSTMTMIMIPMIDQYNVYHLKDLQSSQDFIIAHARNETVLPEETIRCGGILKELNTKESGDGDSQIFLEALYYSVV